MNSPPSPIVWVDEFPVVPTNANSAKPSRSGTGCGGAWANTACGTLDRISVTNVLTKEADSARPAFRCTNSLCWRQRERADCDRLGRESLVMGRHELARLEVRGSCKVHYA